MKTTIAFHALIAAVCNAGHATAQQTSNVRGSVEEREEERREVFADPIVEGAKAVNSDLLNTVNLPITEGAGYDKWRDSIHIPACVGLTPDQCVAYAVEIFNNHNDWFGLKSGVFYEDKHPLDANDGYYYVGIPVIAEGGLVAGDGMVYYRYDWCVDNSGSPQCTSIGPWDCSGRDANDCCANVILKDYPGQDLGGNPLQCYEHVRGGQGSEVCLMSSTVTMHTIVDGGVEVVAIPASIPVVRPDYGCNYNIY
jgi:hypothetical protein